MSLPHLPRPVYPPAYEEAWRRMAMAELDMTPDIAQAHFDARLRPVAAALSDDMTVARLEGLSTAAGGRVRPIVYGLYFFPQTWMRAALMLGEALAKDPSMLAGKENLRMVDLGAGAGAGAWGALEAIAAHRRPASVEIWAVEREASLLRRMEKLAAVARQRLPFEIRIHTLVSDARQVPDAIPDADLLLAVFSMNEWMAGADASQWMACADSWPARLAPDGVLAICEPASEESAAGIRAIRDAWCTGGSMRVAWPCPHARPCPLRGGRGDYCHEVRRWTPPPTVHRWGCALGREIGVVKYCGLVATRQSSSSESSEASEAPMSGRMVAPMSVAAGRLVTRVCGADGQVHACERLTRAMEREDIRITRKWERGDSIAIEGRVLGDGVTWRADEWKRLMAWD